MEAVKEHITESDQARISERISIIADRHQEHRKQADELALSHASSSPITPEWLSYCINQVIDEDAILLDECVTNTATVTDYLQRSQPGTHFKSGGSSLGWGLGAALGVKFASPDKTVVAAFGDGAFIYGCPVSSLWTADVYKAPFLAVIYINQLNVFYFNFHTT